MQYTGPIYELYPIFYLIAIIFSLYYLIKAIRSKTKLGAMIGRIPDGSEKEFDNIMDLKRSKPRNAANSLSETIFYKWWVERNKKITMGVNPIFKIYYILQEKGAFFSILFIIIFFFGTVFGRNYGLVFDFLSILIFLIYVYYVDQTKMTMAFPFIDYVTQHESELTLVDWGLVPQLKSFVDFRVTQLAIISIAFTIVLIFHHVLIESFALVVFGPIGAFFIQGMEFIQNNFGPLGVLVAFLMIVIISPLYFIFFEKILVKGYFFIIRRFMVYFPALKLMPPAEAEQL